MVLLIGSISAEIRLKMKYENRNLRRNHWSTQDTNEIARLEEFEALCTRINALVWTWQLMKRNLMVEVLQKK